jgi:U4/U6 small nuclear ribonucleoprotein SNU13
MAEDNSAAWPQADQALSQEILDLVQQAVRNPDVQSACEEYTDLVHHHLDPLPSTQEGC